MEEKNKLKGICPVCGGNIVSDEKTFLGGKIAIEKESLHCDGCGVIFAFPTPPAISDMMKRHREMNAANTGLLGIMVGR